MDRRGNRKTMGNSIEYKALCKRNKLHKAILKEFKSYIHESTEEEEALVGKVEHMLWRYGLYEVLRMLCSFKNGPKRITSFKWIGGQELEWVQSAHGEYQSYGKNLPKAHFRWNYGERYVLSEDCLYRLELFLDNHGFREFIESHI